MQEHTTSTNSSSIEDIDHIRTKARHPQTNGIFERFHKTIQGEFYSVAFRKKIYNNIDKLQLYVDLWINHYKKERPHSGKFCIGRTPWQTWNESLHLTKNKMLENHFQKDVNLHLTGEAETDSGGDQPARNILSDWNEKGGIYSPQFSRIISRENAFENALPE